MAEQSIYIVIRRGVQAFPGRHYRPDPSSAAVRNGPRAVTGTPWSRPNGRWNRFMDSVGALAV